MTRRQLLELGLILAGASLGLCWAATTQAARFVAVAIAAVAVTLLVLANRKEPRR